MDKFREQRRTFRIKTKSPICIDNKEIGQLMDMSEYGVAFLATDLFPKEHVSLRMTIDGKSHEGVARILRKEFAERNQWIYGCVLDGTKGEEGAGLSEFIFELLLKQCMRSAGTAASKDDVKVFLCGDLKFYTKKLEAISDSADGENPNDSEFFNRITDNILREANMLEKRLNGKTLTRLLKKTFRSVAGHSAFQSKIVRHAYEKPQGYPGDYWLMEMIYNQQPVSDSRLGKLFDAYYLRSSYAVAVRNRKDEMGKSLQKIIAGSAAGNAYNILNIACGSSREVWDLIQDGDFNRSSANWVFLDHDMDALNFCRNRFLPVLKDRCRFVNADVLRLIGDSSLQAEIGKFDLIYTIGLADYLPDRILKKFVASCFYKLLSPGGQLIVAHKDENEDPFAPVAPDWFCDWKFYPRCLQDFKKLVSDAGIAQTMAPHWEASGRIFFLQLRRSRL